jgi:hypothetical protein
MQAAHIVRRGYTATRCDPANGWCLCETCHQIVDTREDEHTALVLATIGVDDFHRLFRRATAGVGDRYYPSYWEAIIADLEPQVQRARGYRHDFDQRQKENPVGISSPDDHDTFTPEQIREARESNPPPVHPKPHRTGSGPKT